MGIYDVVLYFESLFCLPISIFFFPPPSKTVPDVARRMPKRKTSGLEALLPPRSVSESALPGCGWRSSCARPADFDQGSN